MIPPTSIDGTDITGATIDGTDVQEITVDGDVVFSASTVPDSEDLHLRVSAIDDGRSTGNITTIPDLTGNGFDLSGSAEIVNSGAFNKRSYRFNGSSDIMETTFSDLQQPNHIFLAYKIRNNNTSANRVIFDSATGGGTNTRHVYYIGNQFSGNPLTIFAGQNVFGPTVDTNSRIAETLFDGSSSTLYYDNVLETTGNAGSHALGGFAIGANGNNTQYSELDLVELLLYPQDKSAIRQQVYQYLDNKVQ